MHDILNFILNHTTIPAVSAVSAATGAIINKIWTSPKEKKLANREDFKAITDTLFKDLDQLKRELARYKDDAQECKHKYNDLQLRFLEFKAKHSELELRYQIQVNLNRKISEEVRQLEEQIQTHLDKLKNEQATSITDSQGTTEEPRETDN